MGLSGVIVILLYGLELEHFLLMRFSSESSMK